MKSQKILSVLFGFVVSGFAFFFAFKNVPFFDLIEYIKTINYFAVFISSIIVFAGFAFRAFRWQIILGNIAKIKYSGVYHPLMIGFMLNSILPARIGELARPAILNREENIPFSSGIATIVVERVCDIVFLVISFVFVLLFVEIGPGINIEFGGFILDKTMLINLFVKTIVILVILFAAMLFLLKLPAFFPNTGKYLKNGKIAFLFKKITDMLNNIAAVFSIIKSPASFFACMASTFIVWSLVALSQYIMVIGSPGIDMNFFESFAVLIIICFFISIPSVPGYWGIWEAGGIFAMSFFGISGTDAAGFTLANHAVQLFPVILAGIVSAFYLSRF